MSRLTFGIVSILAGGACLAQTSNQWLMQNYRFVEGPAPGDIKPVSPAVAQLQEIQNTMLNILRKADFAGDYEAALAAAYQAARNAQLIGALTGELKPPAPMGTPRGASAPARAPGRLYLIVLKDKSIQQATAIWRDRLMLHYTTATGAHEQVRLDLVDWKRSMSCQQPAFSDQPSAMNCRPSAAARVDREEKLIADR